MSNLPKNARDMFCFAIYGATHAINRAYAPLLKPLGITYPQYITLTLLWETDGQNVGTLAKSLGMETSTLTPLLKRLEAIGLVERRRGEKDERQVFAHLSSKGRSLQKEAKDITACMVQQTGLDLPQLDQLVAHVSQLRKNLENNR